MKALVQIYDVELKVPLGIRSGTMCLEEEAGFVDGYLELFGNRTKFHGRIRNQILSITGVLKTAVREISYQGEGIRETDGIQMQLKSKSTVYELRGYLRTFREAQPEGIPGKQPERQP